MDQEISGAKKLFKWLSLVLVTFFFITLIYFAVMNRFTPSWIIGEQIMTAENFVEIRPGDLERYPNLEKFLKNAQRGSSVPEEKVSVFIKGSHGQGTRLVKFLNEQTTPLPNAPFPYTIKYEGKLYGLDIIYQFKSPLITGFPPPRE